MVSKASELFPDPLRPVITVRLLRGISTSMFFRLCWRAPCTVIRSSIGLNGEDAFHCDAIYASGAIGERLGEPEVSWEIRERGCGSAGIGDIGGWETGRSGSVRFREWV